MLLLANGSNFFLIHHTALLNNSIKYYQYCHNHNHITVCNVKSLCNELLNLLLCYIILESEFSHKQLRLPNLIFRGPLRGKRGEEGRKDEGRRERWRVFLCLFFYMFFYMFRVLKRNLTLTAAARLPVPKFDSPEGTTQTYLLLAVR